MLQMQCQQALRGRLGSSCKACYGGRVIECRTDFGDRPDREYSVELEAPSARLIDPHGDVNEVSQDGVKEIVV